MSGLATTENKFDYAALDTETRVVIQQKTGQIKKRLKRTAQDIIETGQDLLDIKERLGHGSFGKWLEAEFGWSHQTANNLMNVARQFEEIPNGLEFAPRALYLLAAPSTSKAAREEAKKLAASGEGISHQKAKEIKEIYVYQGEETWGHLKSEQIALKPGTEVVIAASIKTSSDFTAYVRLPDEPESVFEVRRSDLKPKAEPPVIGAGDYVALAGSIGQTIVNAHKGSSVPQFYGRVEEVSRGSKPIKVRWWNDQVGEYKVEELIKLSDDVAALIAEIEKSKLQPSELQEQYEPLSLDWLKEWCKGWLSSRYHADFLRQADETWKQELLAEIRKEREESPVPFQLEDLIAAFVWAWDVLTEIVPALPFGTEVHCSYGCGKTVDPRVHGKKYDQQNLTDGAWVLAEGKESPSWFPLSSLRIQIEMPLETTIDVVATDVAISTLDEALEAVLGADRVNNPTEVFEGKVYIHYGAYPKWLSRTMGGFSRSCKEGKINEGIIVLNPEMTNSSGFLNLFRLAAGGCYLRDGSEVSIAIYFGKQFWKFQYAFMELGVIFSLPTTPLYTPESVSAEVKRWGILDQERLFESLNVAKI